MSQIFRNKQLPLVLSDKSGPEKRNFGISRELLRLLVSRIRNCSVAFMPTPGAGICSEPNRHTKERRRAESAYPIYCSPFFCILLCSGLCFSEPASIRPFTTDECTLVDEGPPQAPNAWCHCCVAHDLSYWKGGTRREKELADQEFRRCIASAGYPDQARVMYNAVRIWGGAYLPFVWRWGYGWNYGRGYRELTPSEKEEVEIMLTNKKSIQALNRACSEDNEGEEE